MNYFPFDPDPLESAMALDDKRLRRVFSEAVMTLAECQRVLFPGALNPYPKKMPMPPKLMQWVLNTENSAWFGAWTQALFICVTERWSGGAKEWQSVVKYQQLLIRTEKWRCPAPPAFVNLACSKEKGLDYTHIADTHLAYKMYLTEQWLRHDVRPVIWSVHGRPDWFKGEVDA